MKQSATLLLREPKARFTGRSPASFFMRVSALHFQTKEMPAQIKLFQVSMISFDGCGMLSQL